ncbi:probable beta-1,4-xylosyltransferase IRX9H [Magnolia sinica]|uniref:probable beta-1,4-xylosyltransferase IRX9H n=1 Tax=Magnolia sinica TaxID=86752 RepID=UPI002658F0B9|nr:probable beta-1,4-xylosyltransferase IRX9H [Magnolia sinica]
MASFRRTTSVVQRDGAVQNGEPFSVPSPPHKMSYAHNYLPSGGLLAALFSSADFMVLRRIRSVILGFCSQGSSRPLERSKAKGQGWRRAFFHFFVCFTVGIFIGFTPFLSLDFSVNLVPKHQVFSFDISPPDGNAHPHVDVVRYGTSLLENAEFKSNVSLEMEVKRELRDENSDAFSAESPIQDSNFLYRKLLIIVTPTHPRPFQAYYLNRLAHTLRLVQPPLLWIVVEMSAQSVETADMLRKTGVMYRHLVCNANLTSIKDRGAHQRNVALSHIEKHHLDGIVYFADDYNMYSDDLFEQMREIRRFGTWPVAMLQERKNKAILEGPVCNGSQVIGWHTSERSWRTRRFHVNMSGFAFNSTVLWDPKRWHRPTPESIRHLDTIKEGVQETMFIEQIVEDESQMEGLPNDCSRIMVWHLHIEAPELSYPRGWLVHKNLEVVAPLM